MDDILIDKGEGVDDNGLNRRFVLCKQEFVHETIKARVDGNRFPVIVITNGVIGVLQVELVGEAIETLWAVEV